MNDKLDINKIAHIIWRMSQKSVLAEVYAEDAHRDDVASIHKKEKLLGFSEEMLDSASEDFELIIKHEEFIRDNYPFLAAMVDANLRFLDRAKANLPKCCDECNDEIKPIA